MNSSFENPFSAVLSLEDLRVPVRLGWTVEERSTPQELRLDVDLGFLVAPLACKSDDLAETLCYDELCEVIRNDCASQEFRLVEYLAARLITKLREILPPMVKARVSVTKLKPPVRASLRSVRFTCGESPWTASS